jgi:IPT/TIG domain
MASDKGTAEMKIKKAVVRGSIGVAVGLPLALQLVMPTAASASRSWGPVVIAASPNSGPTSGGTTVTITGEDLTLATAVLFGNVPASYTIVSNTEIIATSPAESVGTVVVQVKDGTVLEPSSVDFTYS